LFYFGTRERKTSHRSQSTQGILCWAFISSIAVVQRYQATTRYYFIRYTATIVHRSNRIRLQEMKHELLHVAPALIREGCGFFCIPLWRRNEAVA
jgi:hypothetical protein